MTIAAQVLERPSSARTRVRAHAGWYDPDSAAFDESVRSVVHAEAERRDQASRTIDTFEIRDSFVEFDWA